MGKRKLTREQIIEEGRYLPKFLRDFHDQKLYFKGIVLDFEGFIEALNDFEFGMFSVTAERLGKLSWKDLQIFVVDYILFLFAKDGYILHKDNRFKEILREKEYKYGNKGTED